MQELRNIPISPTLEINQRVRALLDSGKEVFRFGFGESPFSPPSRPISALSESASWTYYGNVQGEPELRERISQFHMEANRITSTADDIFVAPGSKILLLNIMSCFTEADILIPCPSWVSYSPQSMIAGLNSIKVETSFEEKWRLTEIGLQDALKQKRHKQTLLIMNYPGNPDGLSYTEEELKTLSEFFKKEDILVISDEIYGLLSHSTEHHSLARFYPEGTITTTGLSKWCGAGGWRLGVAIVSPSIDPSFKSVLKGVCSETYSCAAIPVQAAATEAYSSYSNMAPFIEQQNEILRQVSIHVYSRLKDSGIAVHEPAGGFYQLPDFSPFKDALASNGIKTSLSLCNALLNEHGVALLPGSAFGFENDVLTARLAYVDLDLPEDLTDFNMEQHGSKIIKGMDRISDWLH